MEQAHYDRLKMVFCEAQELSGDERISYLECACGEDHGLRRDVERLLAVDDAGGGHLATPRLPRVIAGHAVTGLLGTGGMGVVFAARQANPPREVAIKVLHPTTRLTNEGLRRFQREAEILGRLSHPGIVRVYEAGMWKTADGEHNYIVMELVHGRPLRAGASMCELNVAARIRLLVSVCRAVQHAHVQGVVHRDLKPANVLVTPEGEPKVLDFGVARLYQEHEEDVSTLTRSGQILGTIAYMSPEQVGGGAAPDPRSDVYSLGVIGYELVAGVLPYDLVGRSLAEAARIVAEARPLPLCTIDRCLRGDIETILRKAMEKEPARRYTSAAELADDLERYLRGEPIMARPPSATYVLGKFAGRHRRLVASFGLTATILLAATVICRSLVKEATRQRGVVDAAFEQSRLADDLARKLQYTTAPASYRRTLEEQAVLIEARDFDRPEQEALVRSTLVPHLWRGGCFAEWKAQIDAILSLRDQLGEHHTALLSAHLDAGKGLSTLRRFVEAEVHLRAGLAGYRAEFGGDSVEALQCKATWLHCIYELRRWDELAPELERALALSADRLPRDDLARCSLIRTEAFLAVQRGVIEAPLDSLQLTIEALSARFGSDHPRTHYARMNLAAALSECGRHAEALELYRRELEWNSTTKGSEHPDSARCRYQMSLTLLRAGTWTEVIEELEACHTIFAAYEGPDSTGTLYCRLRQAEAWLALKETARAEPLISAVLATSRRATATDPILVADAQHLLAVLQLASARPSEAESVLAETLAANTAWDEAHPATIRLRRDHARALRRLGRSREAEAELLTCHRLAGRWPGPRHAELRAVALALAELYAGSGREELASLWSDRALIPARMFSSRAETLHFR